MIILDTNVLSEFMRPNPSSVVVEWAAQQRRAELFITAITQAEIFYGIHTLAPGKRRQALQSTAEAMFREDFAGRILSFDSEAARAFAEIAARRRAEGRPISDLDAQIAAIVQTHKAILATRNAPDFEGCDIHVLNPWRN